MWDGNCTETHLCTSASPCGLPVAPVTITSDEKCLIVFQEGSYSKAIITSSQYVVFATTGAVSNLHLYVSAPIIEYSSYPFQTNGSAFINSRFEHELSDPELSVAFVSSLTLKDTFFSLTSSNAVDKESKFSIYACNISINEEKSDFAALLDFVAPTSSTGQLKLLIQESNIRFAPNTTTGFLRSSLKIDSAYVEQSKVDGGAYFFNVSDYGNSSITLYYCDFSNVLVLFEELPHLFRPWSSAHAPFLYVRHSSIAARYKDLGSIGSWDTCAHIDATNSTWTSMNINCNGYMTNNATLRCNILFDDSHIINPNLCLFGEHNSSSSEPSPFSNRLTSFHNTLVEYNDDAIASSLTIFNNIHVTGSDLTLKNGRTDSPTTFSFYGYTSFSDHLLLRVNSIALVNARVQVAQFVATGAIAMKTSSSIAPPRGGILNRWSLVSPLTIIGGSATVSQIDLNGLNFLNFAVDNQTVSGVTPAVQLVNLAAITINDAQKFANITHVQWRLPNTAGVAPAFNTTYTLANITVINHSSSLPTQALQTLDTDSYTFTLSSKLLDEERNLWAAQFKYDGPNHQFACRTAEPNVPGFICKPDGSWTYDGDLTIENTTLIIPPFATYSVTGNITIKNATLQFQGQLASLWTKKCFNWIGKKKIILDYSETSTYCNPVSFGLFH